MAVTIDHISSGASNPAGTNSSFWNTNTIANSTQDGTSFMTISAGATFLLVGAQITGDPATQGTNSFIWDQGGTNQSMTSLGSAVFNSDDGSQLQYFGLVSPTSGTKTLRLSNSGNTSGNANAVVFGISFNGSITTSVAAATEGYASNKNATGTPSATASVSSAVSIPTGDMAVAFYFTNTGGGATFPTDGGTFGDMAFTNSREYESYSGSGVTVNASYATTVSQSWSVLIVGIKAAAAALIPVSQDDWPLPGRYVYSEWQRWTELGNSLLPIPTVLPSNLIVQRDWPNPRDYQRLPNYTWIQRAETTLPTKRVLTTTLKYPRFWPNPQPVTWYRSWEESGLSLTSVPHNPFIQSDWPNPSPVNWYQSWIEAGNSQLPFPTPFLPADIPASPGISWYRSIEDSGNSLTTVVQNPFFQTDWPLPQPITWYQHWSEPGNVQLPFPTPFLSRDVYNPWTLNWYGDWNQNLSLFYQSETFPFVQSDYPNPPRINWYQTWSENLLQNTLTPAFQSPFNQFDWPLPRTYQPIQQFWFESGNVQLPFPTPFFQNVDSPLPVVNQPIDPTWLQNLSEFLQATVFPFSQKDFPNPYPLYWYVDHHQNLVIYLPVGVKPFLQSDWELTPASPPIDQFFYQSLVLNLPEPPPPPIQFFAGRQLTEKDVLRSWMKAIRAKGR